MKPSDVQSFLHAEIQFEHQLISHRMTWYVTSQAFLMAASVVSGATGHRLAWLTAFLPAVGCAVSILTWLALLAAVWSMIDLRKSERDLIDTDAEFVGIRFWTGRPQKIRHVLGLVLPVGLPPVFLTAWVLLWCNAPR